MVAPPRGERISGVKKLKMAKVEELIETHKLTNSSSQTEVAAALPAEELLALIFKAHNYGPIAKNDPQALFYKFEGFRSFLNHPHNQKMMPDSIKEYIFGLVKPLLIQYVSNYERLEQLVKAKMPPSQIDELLADPQVLQRVVNDVSILCTQKYDISGVPNQTWDFLNFLKNPDLSQKSFNLLVDQLKSYFKDGSIIKSSNDFLSVFYLRNKLPAEIRESLSKVLLDKSENAAPYENFSVSLGYSLREYKDKIVEFGSPKTELSSSAQGFFAQKEATPPESSATSEPHPKP